MLRCQITWIMDKWDLQSSRFILNRDGLKRQLLFTLKMYERYKKEYRDYHGKPSQIRKRAMRNAARRKIGLKNGDPRECDHKKPLSKGGTNHRNNLRAVARSTNRRKGTK